MGKWKVVLLLVIGILFSIQAADELHNDVILQSKGRRFFNPFLVKNDKTPNLIEDALKNISGFFTRFFDFKFNDSEQEQDENIEQETGNESER